MPFVGHMVMGDMAYVGSKLLPSAVYMEMALRLLL
jgi:hypothetical protein